MASINTRFYNWDTRAVLNIGNLTVTGKYKYKVLEWDSRGVLNIGNLKVIGQ